MQMQRNCSYNINATINHCIQTRSSRIHVSAMKMPPTKARQCNESRRTMTTIQVDIRMSNGERLDDNLKFLSMTMSSTVI